MASNTYEFLTTPVSTKISNYISSYYNTGNTQSISTTYYTDLMEYATSINHSKAQRVRDFKIRNVEFDDRVTTISFCNDTVALIKHEPNSTHSKEARLAMCLAKYLCGAGAYKKIIDKWCAGNV